MTSTLPLFSQRFQREVCITRHAMERLLERGLSEALLLEVIDTGDTRYKDETHLWVFKSFLERADNLLCAVLVLEDRLIVKTVMHHFTVL
jgi:hypothetical protein